jgi:DNA-binding transcriptional LysR family regulator
LRDLDLTTLRLFVSVCETGNIARAGERPTSSARPSASGWRSWKTRSARRCWCASGTAWCPPPAGQTLLEHARAMLDSAARIERDMQNYAAGARGQVRILASVSAMTESLADDVAAFLHQPAHRTSRSTWKSASAPRSCAACAKAWPRWGSAGTRRPRRAAVAAVPQRPLCHGGAGRPSAGGARVGALRADAGLRAREPAGEQRRAGALQRTPPRSGKTLRHRVIVSNFEAALRVVRAGLAISLVPREVAEPLHLVSELGDVEPGTALGALLDTHPAAAELYENVNYQYAGLCRSALDASLAAELQAKEAIEKAMKPINPQLKEDPNHGKS